MKALESTSQASTSSALRQMLIQAIESLKPVEAVPAQSMAWRTYEVLYYRYVQQCSQEEVADQLGLSVRHLKREQQKALELLAERIREQYHLEIAPDKRGATTAAKGVDETPPLSDELQWLEQSPPTKSVALNQVLPAVLRLVESIAVRHNVCLHTEQAGQLPRLAVHPVALRQMLLSLLCVAIRRTSPGRLEISTHHKRWSVEIRIRAEGPQAPSTAEDEANLAVVRQIAGTSNARLALHDGAGFCAVLTLPAAEQLPVLAIDDNLDTLCLMRRYANGTRYLVMGAQDPEQAFALACRDRPRVIILDVMMPEIDGWEFLGRIKQHPLTSDIPVVVCTILAQEELALSLGATAFLRKPIKRRDFVALLDHLAPLAAS